MRPSPTSRYGVALLAVALATAVRAAISPLIEFRGPFVLMYLAVAVASWYGGAGPGLFATLLSSILAISLFLDPAYTVASLPPSYIVFTVLFFIGGTLISVLAESMHRANERAELTAQELRQQVQERERIAIELEESAKRENAALVESEIAHRAKDEFLATVSHELRTPLNSILGWAQMLQTGRLNHSDVAQAYEAIERSARHQAKLIEDVLDVARIITGNVRFSPAPVEPIAIIENALEIVRPTAEAKGVNLTTDLDAHAGSVSGDEARLQQVVWNLLSNAIKFTPKGGSIEVRLTRVHSHIEIAVTDTGEGIDRHFLPFAFHRFRQAVGSSLRLHGGLGMGLAIVRHLVEIHGGTVEAASEGLGKGSRFTVKLPVLSAAASADLEDEHSENGGPHAAAIAHFEFKPLLKGIRVLIAEDETDAREMLEKVLGGSGADVRACATAAETFAEVQQWNPDVLVSDVGMPDEDGYSLIKRIRDLPENKGGRIPAMALTGYARPEDRVRAISAGFQTHAPKPVEPGDLVAAVAELAERSTANQKESVRQNP